ncbi:MAG: glycosyltransferase family 2 protein, partial [Pseudomonadota bacterium]
TRPTRFKRDMEEARARVAKGEIVTLLSLSRTTLYHRVFFDPSGVWVQRGGLFGRAERSEPLILMTTRSRRVEKERRRVALLRAMGDDNE